MNHNIKELAIKSGIAYFSEHTAYLPANDGLTVLPSVSSLEKFAELIIRECCGILTENVEVALDASGSPVYPEGLIYEHFGVEE